jgi:pSer/pThr/pTyr-binding forkhead associated (FHA) protein
MPSARTCRKCGVELSRAEQPTRPAPDEGGPDEQEPPEATTLEEPSPPAAAPADRQASARQMDGTDGLTLVVIGPGQRIRLQGPGEFTLGRTDPEEEIYVTVDLSDYDAWESGVSRRHARIYTAEGRFWLEDAQSANGTFLNEEYLAPGQFRPLRAGDLIKLGILRLYVASVG